MLFFFLSELMLNHLSGLTQSWGYHTFPLITQKCHLKLGSCVGLHQQNTTLVVKSYMSNFFPLGYDVIAQAQSGTGKTATFAISILQQLEVETKETQALVLAPTRELAQQVRDP